MQGRLWQNYMPEDHACCPALMQPVSSESLSESGESEQPLTQQCSPERTGATHNFDNSGVNTIIITLTVIPLMWCTLAGQKATELSADNICMMNRGTPPDQLS